MNLKNILISVVAVVTIGACHQKTAIAPPTFESMTNKDLVKHLQSKGTYYQVVRYANFSGIKVDSTRAAQDSTTALLEEIGYGHRPAHLQFVKTPIAPDTALIRQVLIDLAKGNNIVATLRRLEPKMPAYNQLRRHYMRLEYQNSDSIKYVAEAMNAYRWINRQAKDADRVIVVNTRGAYLRGIDVKSQDQISMRVIVGKKESPTPTMTTYATDIVSYPTWTVPRSIIEEEMLPSIKKNVEFLTRNRIEVVDNKGNVINPNSIDWENMDETNFPYQLRQVNGLDNSLGVVKVNIQNPYSVYLHDTNSRGLFKSEERWRSHGCIRLQEPAKLANFIAGQKVVDEGITQKEVDPEQDTKVKKLREKVPVFILYLPADVDSTGKLAFYHDVYNWETSAE